MPTTLEIAEKYRGKSELLSQELGSFKKSTGDQGEPIYDIPTEKRGDVDALIKEVDSLGKELKESKTRDADILRISARDESDREAQRAKNLGIASFAAETEQKSIGEQFKSAISGTVKEQGIGAIKQKNFNLEIDAKTLMTRGAGYAPQSLRNGRLIALPQAPIRLLDKIPTVPTQYAAVKYMRETTYTNNAAPVAEGGTYPEAALAFTEQTAIVEKIAVYLPTTDEQLEDVDGLEAMLDNRLELMIRQKIEDRFINGTGTTPDVLGILNVPGAQTHARGSDTVIDAILKAIVRINAAPAYSNADGIAINPSDWQGIMLAKDSQGRYLLGGPLGPNVTTLWGVDLLQVPRMPAGTSVVGDWATYSEMDLKRDVTLQISNSHADNFIKGIQAIRADVRLAAVWYRAVAFDILTGLNA